MSKRAPSDLPPPARKQPRSSFGTTQSTLHKFFNSSSGETSRPILNVDLTPQYMGIHMFSEKNIAESTGLDRDYKEFWNAKAAGLCQDKAVTHKLKDKAAIQGAINSSWTLHKSDLLQLQAEELAVYVSQAYTDKIAQASTLSSVQSNKKKMIELTESIRLVYADATEEMGDEVSELMKELRKSQSALKKAIDRKNQELDRMNAHPPLTATAPETTLSTDELQELVQEIKQEPYEFEPLPTDPEATVVPDSNPSSRCGSPEIPLLPGLDSYKR